MVMYTKTKQGGQALWCWWRPKWESEIEGTDRKDGLRVLECTIFRVEGPGLPRSSLLIEKAVEALQTERASVELHLRNAGPIDSLITGVASEKTRSRRSQKSKPGACFLHAGWNPMEKRAGKADAWLCLDWENPFESGDDR